MEERYTEQQVKEAIAVLITILTTTPHSKDEAELASISYEAELKKLPEGLRRAVNEGLFRFMFKMNPIGALKSLAEALEHEEDF